MSRAQPLRLAFAGDRLLAVRVLNHLRDDGVRPLALMLSGPDRASHAEELVRRCPDLPADRVLRGREFRSERGIELLRSLDLDLVLSIHFPYLLPADVLGLAREGVLNLHPAYLPYNKGWHTPSWAILDGTPYGATLHFMTEEIDAGDIVHRKRIDVDPGDTADSLYQRVLDAELDVFREAWPSIRDSDYDRTPQDPDAGTVHRRTDLLAAPFRRLDPDETLPVSELLRKLRALTTNRADEACYYEIDGRRYHVQLRITESGNDAPEP